MKIKTITSEHRNDFCAVMECEHCGATQENPYGYHDTNYHTRVIPMMHCKACGKNRAWDVENSGHGETVATPNDLKLSDGGGWRAGCTVGGKAAAEAASVTAGAVRCSAWLGDVRVCSVRLIRC